MVNAVLASGLPPSSFGMDAQEVIGERTLVALNEVRPYAMASTTKVVTSLAALDLLGPFYRWRSSAFALGTLADGKLVGDLLIVGGGNAQLTSAELQAWFGRMRKQGLREIDGDIVLDHFAFQLSSADHARTPPQSADQPRPVWPAALTLDEGLLGVTVEPTRGKRAAIALKPALSEGWLDNQVTMGSGCEASAHWVAGNEVQAAVLVRGSWRMACGSRTISFLPPVDSGDAARALPAMWAAAGGVLRGRVVAADVVPGVSPIPAGPDGEPLQPLSFHRSKPLPEMLRDMTKVGDNVAARNLMLSLSPGFPGRPATLAGAQKTVGMWLRNQGLVDGDVEVEIGSNLPYSERQAPRAGAVAAQGLARQAGTGFLRIAADRRRRWHAGTPAARRQGDGPRLPEDRHAERHACAGRLRACRQRQDVRGGGDGQQRRRARPRRDGRVHRMAGEERVVSG